MSSYGITKDDISTIYFGTLNTHPRYFYVKSAYVVGSSTGGIVSKIDIQYTMNKSEAMKAAEEYDRAIADAVRGADSSWSDMEKALYVNDYLARNCQYVKEASNAHSSYGALVDKEAVCQGYALAFLELTRQLGVTCEMVTSDSVNHAWNMIKVGDNYYHVDVTWNDPLNDMLGRACHIYFMKSTDFFKNYESENGNTHFSAADWVITSSVSETAASNTSYDSYLWDNIDAGFDYVNGSWYGFNGTDFICQYTCDGQEFSKVSNVITVNEWWDAINGGYWSGKYVGTGAYGGEYYYSGSTAIYKLDVSASTSNKIFELTEAQKKTGRIYGINITPSGQLQYALSETPNESGTVTTLKELSGETKPNLYTIHFDGNCWRRNGKDVWQDVQRRKYVYEPLYRAGRAGDDSICVQFSGGDPRV